MRARRARVVLPGWLGGGNPRELAASAKWVANVDDDGSWLIALEERAKGRRPRLLVHRRLVNARNLAGAGSYSLLKALPPHDAIASADHRVVRAEIERMIASGEVNVATRWNAVSLATLTSPESQLAANVRECLEGGLLTDFPDASVHLVRVGDEVPMRFVAVRALLQAEEDPDLWKDPQLFQGFKSAVGLLDNTLVGWRPYFGVYLLALSPWVLGIPTARVGAVIVYLFGVPVNGTVGDAVEPIHLAAPHGRTATTMVAQVTPSEIEAGLAWWTESLNRVVAEMLDPCNFVGDGDRYRLVDHLQALLTLEHAFLTVHTLLAADRDKHARRLAMFAALDTLEGLHVALTFEKMTRLGFARRTLESLENRLPSGAGAVLLPKARQAVTGLEKLQSGFFLRSRVADRALRRPDKSGKEATIPLEAAASEYLRMLRNSGHGFSRGDRAASARDEALLVSHTGELPEEVLDLPYLYLLHVMANPALLRRFLPRRAEQ